MAKVDEKWFKDRGWRVIENVQNFGVCGDCERRSVVCDRWNGSSNAMWEHVYEVYPGGGRTGKTGRSNFYTFRAQGKGYTVKTTTSHRKYEEEDILTALKLVGLE